MFIDGFAAFRGAACASQLEASNTWLMCEIAPSPCPVVPVVAFSLGNVRSEHANHDDHDGNFPGW